MWHILLIIFLILLILVAGLALGLWLAWNIVVHVFEDLCHIDEGPNWRKYRQKR